MRKEYFDKQFQRRDENIDKVFKNKMRGEMILT